MPASMGDMKVREFVETLGSKVPAPGGGAASAVTAALAAAVGKMVVEYSVGKKSLAGLEGYHAQALRVLAEMAARALELADEDARAYEHLNALWKLDANDPRRAKDMPAAVERAIAAPVEVMDACSQILEQAADLAGKSNRMLRSDLAIAAILAEAGLRSSAWNVRINLGLLDNQTRAEELMKELDARVESAMELSQAVELASREH